MRFRRFLVFALATGFLISMSPTGEARAAIDTSGTWYWDALKIQAAHDAGFTGKGVTIAMIDSTFNPAVPTLQGANIVVPPSQCWNQQGKRISPTSTSLDPTGFNAFHGTNVASLIVGTGAGYPGQTGVRGVAPDAKLLYYAGNPVNNKAVCFTQTGERTESSNVDLDIADAVSRGADIISMSFGTKNNLVLAHAVAKAEHAGVIFVVGYPNTREQRVGGQGGLAKSNGAITVGSTNSVGVVSSLDGEFNFGYAKEIDVIGPGVGILTQGSKAGGWQEQKLADGNSMATPIVASILAVVKQKYPKATSNQLIQSLLRNTGGGGHDLIFDSAKGHGYGIASLTSMLEIDPSVYEDVNPLIDMGEEAMPPAWLIKNPISLKAFISSPDVEPTVVPKTDKPTDSKNSFANGAFGGSFGILIFSIFFGICVALGFVMLAANKRARRRMRSTSEIESDAIPTKSQNE